MEKKNLQIKDVQEAIKSFTDGIKKAPTENQLLYDLYFGRGLAEKGMKNFRNAIEDFEKAITINPLQISSYLEIFNCQFELGKFMDAIETFKKHLVVRIKQNNKEDIKDKLNICFCKVEEFRKNEEKIQKEKIEKSKAIVTLKEILTSKGIKISK